MSKKFIFFNYIAERRPRRRENRSEFDASSVMSSDLETTSFVDSDEESQMSSATESSRYVGGQRRRRRRRQRMPRVERVRLLQIDISLKF